MSQNSFVCTQLTGFKYRKRLNISIQPIYRTLTGTINPGQSGPESNDNEGVFHISQTPRLEPYHQM